MAKVVITGDQMLAFVQAVFNDADIDVDQRADEFGGKTLADALNVEYYTFKKRPESSEQIMQQVAQSGGNIDQLLAVHRGFCGLTLDNVTREFSFDTDTATVQGVLDFWVQTNKIKLLEYLVDKCNTQLAGRRIPVVFPGNENRGMVLSFGTVRSSVPEQTELGETVIATVHFEATFNPDVYCKSDYEIAIKVGADFQTLPIISFTVNSAMSQDEKPHKDDCTKTGMFNLGNAKSFEIVCDGFANLFNLAFDYLLEISLATVDEPDGYANKNVDVNTKIPLRITRGTKAYYFTCVLQHHALNVADNADNEQHVFVLTPAAETDDMLSVKVGNEYKILPTLSFMTTTQMTQQTIPFGNDPTMAGAFNVHSLKQFQFSCHNLRDNLGLRLIKSIALAKDNLTHNADINTPIEIQIMYDGEQYRYSTVLTSAVLQINEKSGVDDCTIVLTQMNEQDTEFAIKTGNTGNESNDWTPLPCLSYDVTSAMTQDGVPFAATPQKTETVNLGNSKVFAFTCQNLQNNAALDFLVDLGLQTDTTIVGGDPVDNNKVVRMRLKRKNNVYDYNCVLSQYLSKFAEDTGQPTHQFTLTQGGE